MRKAIVLCLFFAACSRSESPTGEGAHPSFPNAPVIVISIDTLRADHLPAYGYTGVQTPAIDAFRRDSILFERAYAHVPLTLPSHISMLTGLLPPQHGVRSNIGYTFDAKKHVTLPALLKKHGYATGAAVSSYVLRGASGLGEAFDDYDDEVSIKGGASIGAQQRQGAITSAIATTWIDRHKDSPFFYMLHLFEPHSPYEPPEPHRSRWKLPYDGEIATVDAIVGGFVEQLKRMNVYDSSVIIFLSDHGEGLGQHGEDEHGIFLYQESIRVPLLVKLPKGTRAGESVSRVVQLADIFPTVTALVGADAPAQLAGSSLLGPAQAGRRVYAESHYPRIHLGWSELRSLVDERYQFIEAPKPELYDLQADPGETKNILSDQRRVYAAMRKEIDTIGPGEQTTGNIDPEEAKKLAALGYLSASASPSTGPLPDPKERIGELQSLKRASMFMAEKNYDAAARELRTLVEANPRFTDAWTMLARTLQDAGRIDEAIATYKRNIELNPALAGDLGLSAATLFLTKNQLDEAEAHARLGEKTNPAMAHVILGRVAMARGDANAAMQHAQTAIGSHAYRVQGLVLAAQILARTGQAPRALELVAQADGEIAQRQLGPIPLLEYTRGDAFARMNRVQEAEAAFRKEVRLFPDNREAWASLAVVFWLRGQPAEARRTMDEFVRANPSPDAYRFAAKTFRELGDAATAEMYERRARQGAAVP